MIGDRIATCAGRGKTQRAGYRFGSMRSRGLLSVAAVAALAAGIAGCGGSSNSGTAAKSPTPDNGVAAKSPDAIVASVNQATTGVKSVHVSGSVTSGSTPITVDLSLLAGKGGSGRMSLNGVSFRMVVVNKTVYLNGSDAFWQKVGARGGALQLLHGRWFKAPVSGQFQGVAKLADLHALFTGLLTGHGTLAKGARSTIAGQKVIAVKDTTKGGTLYVATTGKPYPVEVSGVSGGQTVSVKFDRYNQPISLSAPANSIDATQLSSS